MWTWDMEFCGHVDMRISRDLDISMPRLNYLSAPLLPHWQTTVLTCGGLVNKGNFTRPRLINLFSEVPQKNDHLRVICSHHDPRAVRPQRSTENLELPYIFDA
jgi:hypothetical protein